MKKLMNMIPNLNRDLFLFIPVLTLILYTIIGEKQLDWFISNIINLSVAIGTLYLAYLGFRQIGENNSRIHMADLRELTGEWLKFFPIIEMAEYDKYSHDNFGFEKSSYPHFDEPIKELPLFSIENHRLFEDFFYHFPEIKENWTILKEKIVNYDISRKNLICEITEYISKKSTYFGIPNIILKEKFPLSVYIEMILLAKGKNNKYGYEVINKPGKRFELKHVSDQTLSIAMIDDKDFDQNLENLTKIHKKIIEECKNEFAEHIKKIIDTEIELKKNSNDFKLILEDTRHYISLPKPDCKYIKPE